jgi:hypothetical protein
MFENKVVFNEFGPKKDEVGQQLRLLHDEKLRYLQSHLVLLEQQHVGCSDKLIMWLG